MQHPVSGHRTVGGLGVAVLLGLTALVAAPVAHAREVQHMWERGCPFREVVVASQTTGRTWHRADGVEWDKGVKADAGATTYTGRQYVVQATVEAATRIASAGTRCP